MMKHLVMILFIFSFVHSDDFLSTNQDKYVLGEGVQIASLPLYVGGYFSALYQAKEHTKKYQLDDVALLLYGDYEKFSYVSEFEFKELYTYTKTENDAKSEQNTNIHIERLYFDYNYDENYQARVGKYNSPIGFWNMLPVNVLRDTTSNPIVTDIIFPRFTTGVSVTYSSYEKNAFQVDVLAQHNNDLDYNYNNYHMDEHFGLGFTYLLEDLSLKMNLGTFDNLRKNGTSEILYYGLLSFKYEQEKYQLTSELGSQYSQKKATTPYAGYLQGVYNVTQEHAAILRLEVYKDEVTQNKDNIVVFAYTYRPLFPVALKAEYQLHSLEEKNQILFSVSVLF